MLLIVHRNNDREVHRGALLALYQIKRLVAMTRERFC